MHSNAHHLTSDEVKHDSFEESIQHPDLDTSIKNEKFLQAVADGKLNEVKKYIASGQNICVVNKRGDPALHLAIKGKHKEMVSLLLENGADPNQGNFFKNNALTYAVSKNADIDIIKELVNFNADINLAIFICLQQDKIEILSYFAKSRTIFNLKDPWSGKTVREMLNEKSYGKKIIKIAKRKRTIFAFSSNESIALSLPYTLHELKSLNNNPQKLLFASRDYIIEHAKRRTDLFFYTLIGYYKSGLHIHPGRTTLQYGIGRGPKVGPGITAACHSSFFSSLIPDKLGKENIFNDQFIRNLSSTVELPKFVNQFDTILEHMRPDFLEIINSTSMGVQRQL